MKKALLIINPVAGTLKIKNSLLGVIRTFCEADFDLTVKTTAHPGHAIEIAENSARQGFDLICCSGGDGTLHEVFSGVLRSGTDVPVGYIPAGTTNDFAEALNIPSTPVMAAKAITCGSEARVDIGSFNNQYFSYIASFGAFTDITYSAPQDLKNKLGYLAYMLEGAKDLTEIKPVLVSYTANGISYSGKYIFGGVSNSTSVAGGIIKLKDNIVDFQDGKFELIMIHSPKDVIELGEILHAITFQDYSTPLIEFMQISEAEFNMPDNINWTLDGEKGIGSNNISIKALHKAVGIIK